MTNPNFGDRSLEAAPGAAGAMHDEFVRRQAEGHHGEGMQAFSNVLAGLALFAAAVQIDLRKNQALGFDVMKYAAPDGPGYWMIQAANMPVDYKGTSFALATGAAAYGARLVSRRDRFPIDQAKTYKQLSAAISYDPSTARSFATRRKVGDVVVGALAAGAAYFIGEQLDLAQTLVATGAAIVTGWTTVLGSKARTAVYTYKAKQERPAQLPVERPGLEDGKTIH